MNINKISKQSENSSLRIRSNV